MSAALCPEWAPFYGLGGITLALALSALGAAYGTARAGVAIAATAVFHPTLVLQCLVPVVMASVLTIYGTIVAILIYTAVGTEYAAAAGAWHLGAGLVVGLGCVAAGGAIGRAGASLVRAFGRQGRMLMPMVLVLVFAEVLAIYGLLVAVLMLNTARGLGCGPPPQTAE
jgi:V-type H+-transporting ATPase proteolipid subunit